MKKMGRSHRPFFRICATDIRTPRDGRVLEELGTYDPLVPDTHARAQLNCERVDYWLGVGAQPSDKVRVLIKKYGSQGTHKKEQEAALAKAATGRVIPAAPEPVPFVKRERNVKRAPEPVAAPAESAEAAAEPAAEATESSEPATA